MVTSEMVRMMRRQCLLAARAVAVMTGAFIAFALVFAAFSSSPTWIEEPTFWSVAAYVAATVAMVLFVIVRDLFSDQNPED